jgi:hypothetical protein
MIQSSPRLSSAPLETVSASTAVLIAKKKTEMPTVCQMVDGSGRSRSRQRRILRFPSDPSPDICLPAAFCPSEPAA